MRTMRSLVLGLLLLFAGALLASLPSAAGSGAWIPLHAGAEWTYKATGTKTGVVKIRVTGAAKAGVWPLVVDGTDSKVRLSDNGMQLLQIRHVGAAGLPVLTTVADLRWSGADTWQAQTASGCLVCNLDGRREGTETLEVPAGRFECLKITNKGIDNETWWLARGVGLVKRVVEFPRSRVEWTLQSHH